MKLGRLLVMMAVSGFTGVVWAAGGTGVPASGNPGGMDLMSGVAIDPEALAKAVARGQAMLKAAKWEAPVPVEDLKGGSAATIALFDAGDSLIWWPSRYATSTVVEKATGKAAGPRGSSMVAVAKGDKGVGEMIVRRAAPPRGDVTWSLEMMGVVDGKQQWQVDTASYTEWALIADKWVFTGPAVPGMIRAPLPPGAEPRVVTSTDLTLEIWAHDRDSGKKLWSYTLPAGTLGAKPFAYAGGVLYATTMGPMDRPGGTWMALNAADGKPVFTAALGADMSPLAVCGGDLVASSASGELVGFDGKTGKEKWRVRTAAAKAPGRGGMTEVYNRQEAPVIAGDKILVRVIEDGAMAGLAAFDAQTHQQVWSFRPPDDENGGGNRVQPLRLIGLAAEKNEAVAVTDSGQEAYLGVDLRTGKLDWYLRATSGNKNGLRAMTKPVISDGVVYLVKDAKLLALPLDAK